MIGDGWRGELHGIGIPACGVPKYVCPPPLVLTTMLVCCVMCVTCAPIACVHMSCGCGYVVAVYMSMFPEAHKSIASSSYS